MVFMKKLKRSIAISLVLLLAMVGTAYAMVDQYINISGSSHVFQSIVIGIFDESGGCHLTWTGQETDLCVNETLTSAAFSFDVTAGEYKDIGVKIRNLAWTDNWFQFNSSSDSEYFYTDVTPVYYEGYDFETESCTGDYMEYPVEIKLEAWESKWFCVRYAWELASTPAEYGITFHVLPDTE